MILQNHSLLQSATLEAGNVRSQEDLVQSSREELLDDIEELKKKISGATQE